MEWLHMTMYLINKLETNYFVWTFMVAHGSLKHFPEGSKQIVGAGSL